MCLASDGAAAGKELEHIMWKPGQECSQAASSSPAKGPQHAQPAADRHKGFGSPGRHQGPGLQTGHICHTALILNAL